ncbi:hypothetical protein K2X33_16485 [bacterium]|nr:hypothetical protein [bacterium]
MSGVLRSFVFVSVFAGLAGCGNAVRDRFAAASGPAGQQLALTISAPSFLTDTKRDIYFALRDKKEVTFGDITYALMEDHYNNWVERHPDQENPSLEDVAKRVDEAAKLVTSEDLAENKNAVEKGLSRGTLVYNATAISILDILYTNRTQPFSGTALQQIVWRRTWDAKKFADRNIVLIYESGHVLPGYLKQIDGAWHLFGTETAVEGTARVVYGPLNKAVKARMLRIVDANLGALVDLFKFEADDVVGLANQALQLTAEKYGIVDPPYLVRERFRREPDFGKIQWSPFLFGNPDAGKTDRTRAAFEEQAREKLPRLNPNITVLFTDEPAPQQTPTTLPKGAQFDAPPYPYREIKVPKTDHPEGRAFQCWDYKKHEWITMSHTSSGDRVRVLRNPCQQSKMDYPELPLPLELYKEKPRPRTGGGYRGYGGYNDDDDYDSDVDYDGWDDDY